MFEDLILEEALSIIRSKIEIELLMGVDFKVYRGYGRRAPSNYMVQRLKLSTDSDPVTTGNYWLDIHNISLNQSDLSKVAHYLRVAFASFAGSHTCGGLRFIHADTSYQIIDEEIQKCMMLFKIRGVDAFFVEDIV